MRHFSSVAGVFLSVWLPCESSSQQFPTDFHFEDVSDQCGLQPFQPTFGMGTGAAAADYDNDGWVDVFLPTGDEPNRLYRNLGNGVFTDVATAVGVDSQVASRCALLVDFGGDGLCDLLTANDAVQGANFQLLEQQLDGSFVDVTSSAGLAFNHQGLQTGGMCAGDIDQDGFLDLYVCIYLGGAHLLRNKGNGSFVDITTSSGVLFQASNSQWQPVMHDFNGDGLLDLYVAVDFFENALMINQGDLTFTNVSVAAGLNNAMNDMGMALGDYDADGDLDIYITNIYDDSIPKHNVLFRNDSNAGLLNFTEVAQDCGVEQGHWGWGASFFDANLDGHLDLAATNGWMLDTWYPDSSRMFVNVGEGFDWFADQSDSTGFHDQRWGSALLAFDYDRDGDVDLLQVCNDGSGVRLLANHAPQNSNGLVVQPRMEGPNSRAIGSVVRASFGTQQAMRLITAGTSYLGQEPAEAHFGLGQVDVVDELKVEFPDGRTSVIRGLDANQRLTVGPPPFTSFAPGTGQIVGGKMFELQAADDQHLALSGQGGQGTPQFEATWQTSIAQPSSISVLLEAHATLPRMALALELYDWSGGQFIRLLDTYLSTQDRVYAVHDIPAAPYVNPAGGLRLRARTARQTPGLSSPVTLRLDLLEFQVQ